MDVKSIIKQKGFTIDAVAQKMGITRVTLSQNLSRNPTIGTLQKIADVVGCKVGDFFVDDISEPINDGGLTCPNCGATLELKVKED